MLEASGAADLLATARKALVEELLPVLPQEKRFVALMIANAMAIAGRQVESAPDPDTSLQSLSDRGVATGATPIDMLMALCANIRSGTYDPGRAHRATVQSFLQSFAVRRCAVSNPKAVQSR